MGSTGIVSVALRLAAGFEKQKTKRAGDALQEQPGQTRAKGKEIPSAPSLPAALRAPPELPGRRPRAGA